MSWLRSSTSRNKASDIRRGIVRLFQRATDDEVYTLPDLAERLKPSTVDELLTVLAELTRDHVIDQIFRVHSPKNRGGIGDFDSLDDVPDRMEDWRQQGIEINVEPQLVSVLFRKHVGNAGEDRGH